MKKRILLVDDNQEIRSTYKRSILENYEVDEANNIDDALNIIKKRGNDYYDLIITDKDLEDKYGKTGGIHLIKTLKKQGYKKPIMLNSGSLEEDEKDELKKLGIESFSKIDAFQKIKKKLEEMEKEEK